MATATDIKILIGVTFREFNGSENEKIQRLFIESVRDQTYPNWRMVVSIFNEKNVQPEIEKYGIDAVFYRNGPVNGYRFSLTDVLLNTIHESNIIKESIILWTTCDVILQDDFFDKIIAHSAKNCFAITHPHITYRSIKDLSSGSHIPASLNSGLDLMIMDGDIFRNEQNVRIVQNYRFIDWGIFEHFLVGLALLNNSKRINLFGISNISKIENNREGSSETNSWLLNCWLINKAQLDRFIYDYKLSIDLVNLTYCHMQFQVLKNTLTHYLKFSSEYLIYFLSRRVYRLLPDSVKKMIKKAIR